MTNSIDPTLYLDYYQQSQTNESNNSLGKDEFLNILMVQLQNQDPLNPMDDTEFISQMAQFTSLEQMSNIADSFEEFIAFQKQNTLSSYIGWIGKQVDWEIVYETVDDEGNVLDPTVKTGTGVIESIVQDGDVIELHLTDGNVIYPDEIQQVQNQYSSPYENQLAVASQMIGKMVSYANEDSEYVESIVRSVQMKNGNIQYELEDGTILYENDIVKVSSQ